MNSPRKQFTAIFETLQAETPTVNFAVLLTAPPEIASGLEDIRRRYDPAFKVGIPAHITLKRPALLDNQDKVPAMRQAFGPVAQRTRPIEVQLQGYGIFRAPGRSVVYLKVQDEQPFCDLHMRVIEVLTEFFPNAQADQFEVENYHPHLTIGNELNDLDLAVLEHELASGRYRLDWSFVFGEMTLSVTQPGQPWQVIETFQFGGQ